MSHLQDTQNTMAKLAKPLISEEAAAQVENTDGKSDVILICEHAGRQLPQFIASLDIDNQSMSAHIAWDIGAAGLARFMSAMLDAPLISQRYSRLVYDCNRSFDEVDAIVEVSDEVIIPKNRDLSKAQRQSRYDVVYQPFYEAIDTIIESRAKQGRRSVIVTVHSFTPIYKGQQRSIELGVIHDTDSRLADAVLFQAQQDQDYHVARNQPYSPEDGVTHTLITHGVKNNLLNLMFEVRNDLISDASSQQRWARRLSGLLSAALANQPGSREKQ